MGYLIYLGFCIGVGVFASNKGRSGIGWSILAFLFSPLLAGVVLACLRDLKSIEDVNAVNMEHQNLKDRVVSNERLTEYRLGRVEIDVDKLHNIKLGSNNQKSDGKTRLIDSGNKLCPACAEVIKETAIKCKHCGVMLNEISTVECPFCSEEINATETKCRHCKSELNPDNNISISKKVYND